MGYPFIIITGDDKGNRLRDKLLAFENSKNIRVLLTTLQKSAEGFNFFFATHVIILEFWWNPQKIIQAMSRIDRKTQSRNIFIYLLCYNYDGEMIKQEICFYEKMVNKLTEANKIYQRIEQNHPKKTPELMPVFNIIPQIINFMDINTFKFELFEFIGKYLHSNKNNEITYDKQGFSLRDKREQMIKEANDYLYNNSILENYPWKIENDDVKKYLICYYENKIHGEHGIALIQSINDNKNEYEYNQRLNTHYKTVYFDRFNLKVALINGKKGILQIIYVIGKRANGKYDLFGIYYCPGNNSAFIFDNIKKRGVRQISIIIAKMLNFDFIKSCLKEYFPNANLQCCITYLHKYLIKGVAINQNELDHFDMVLSAKTINKARRLCEKAEAMKFDNKFIFRRLINNIPNIALLYKLKPIFANVNLITYITNLILLLIQERVFINKEMALTIIRNTSKKILEEGEHFIPNWDKMTGEID
jgi:transposase-like protein